MQSLEQMERWGQASLGPRERWPERLSAVLELCAALPTPAAILWGTELVLLPNPALAVMLGEDVDAFAGRSVVGLASAEGATGLAAQLALASSRALERRTVERTRFELRAPSGVEGAPREAHPVALTATPLALGVTEGAAPSAVLVTVEHESASAEVERRIAALEREQLEEREQMFGVVAHDLKNPLNVISLSIYQLAMPQVAPELRDRWKRPIDAIKRAARRIDDILGDMLDLARLDVGPLVLDREVQDSTKLVAEILEHIVPIAPQKQVQLDASVEPRLAITCDKARFLRVLTSLLNDALVASPSHGIVRLAGHAEGDWAVFEVHDMGPGLAPEERPRMFDRRQARRKDERRKLRRGLPLAKSLVEAQGGRLTVDTPPGLGMIVRLFFPLSA